MLTNIQQEQLKKALLQLGFSEKEIIVYLSILQNADSSVLSIAKSTELSRGTVFDIVEKLKEKGFVAEVKKGKKRRLIVESPTNKFYSLLEERHDRLKKEEEIVEDILPLIKGADVNADFKPQIKVYTGEKGFRQVWDDIFSCGEKKFLSIARIETFVKFSGEEFLQEIQDRKISLGFSSRAINEDSNLSKKMKSTDKKYNRETRLAPKEFVFPSTEIIYGDKIAMFSTREENIIVVIESKDFAQTHKVYFEMIWELLENKDRQ